MLWYRDPRISTVFLGKNLLALAVKMNSAWERHRQEQRAGGTGSTVEAGDSTLPSQSSEPGEGQVQGKGPHYHSLTRSQSHTLSHVSLEPSEAALGPSFISHEL